MQISTFCIKFYGCGPDRCFQGRSFLHKGSCCFTLPITESKFWNEIKNFGVEFKCASYSNSRTKVKWRRNKNLTGRSTLRDKWSLGSVVQKHQNNDCWAPNKETIWHYEQDLHAYLQPETCFSDRGKSWADTLRVLSTYIQTRSVYSNSRAKTVGQDLITDSFWKDYKPLTLCQWSSSRNFWCLLVVSFDFFLQVLTQLFDFNKFPFYTALSQSAKTWHIFAPQGQNSEYSQLLTSNSASEYSC